jgi:Na+-translocating ferredoxin:NAD+ oxidoreductase RnfD subunit
VPFCPRSFGGWPSEARAFAGKPFFFGFASLGSEFVSRMTKTLLEIQSSWVKICNKDSIVNTIQIDTNSRIGTGLLLSGIVGKLFILLNIRFITFCEKGLEASRVYPFSYSSLWTDKVVFKR